MLALTPPIEFTVPGEPVPWARAGGGKTTFRFTPQKQRNFMAVVKDSCAVSMRGRRMLEGPVELSVLAIYAWPKSWSGQRCQVAGAEWKCSRPDADNLVKIVKDALNTVAWRDDAQVASGHFWKKYGETPRMTVRITALAGR